MLVFLGACLLFFFLPFGVFSVFSYFVYVPCVFIVVSCVRSCVVIFLFRFFFFFFSFIFSL